MQPTRGLDMQIGFRRGFFFLVFCGPFGAGVGKGGCGVVCVFFSLVHLCIIATCNSIIENCFVFSLG